MSKLSSPLDSCPPCGEAAAEGELAGLRLLVVDDVDINCELASGLLEAVGACCEAAEDGLQALQRLRAAAAAGAGFDGVFMDVQMPVMDGLQATRHIRSDPALAAVPVIALTAGALPHQRQAALDAGMNDFIAKPIRLEVMVATLLRHLPGRPGAAAPHALAEAGAVTRRDAAAPAPAASLPVVPGVDAAQAERRLRGNRVLFLSMLRSLRDDFGDTAQRTRDDLACGDTAAAVARLHRLRGLAGNACADTVSGFAGRLEDLLRADAAQAGPRAIEPALAVLEMALRQLLAGLPPEVEQPYGVPAAAPAAARIEPSALRELLQALGAGDMDAFPQYHALRPLLAAHHGPAALDELDRAMDLLRFQQVGAMLRGWYPQA